MFMGVPYIPFFLGAGTCVLFAAWFNLFWLLGIRLQFWVKARNRQLHQKMWVFTPNSYRKDLS